MEDEPKYKMPKRFMFGSTYNTTMIALEVNDPPMIDNGKELLFGFYLPDFQRPPVWDRNQNIRFLESVWLELPIGSYIINRLGNFGELDNMLLDGQQRLRAIKAYLDNDFPVLGYYWNGLTVYDKRRWKNLSFPRIEVQEERIEVLKDIYNRFNFGGTPHTLDQMAK